MNQSLGSSGEKEDKMGPGPLIFLCQHLQTGNERPAAAASAAAAAKQTI